MFHSCDNSNSKHKEKTPSTKKNSVLKYAKRFSITELDSCTIVCLFGDRNNYDTTNVFVIYKTATQPTYFYPNTHFIKSPCKKIAALSSIYASMFYELGVIENLVAIDNIDYVVNSEIISKHKNNNLK